MLTTQVVDADRAEQFAAGVEAALAAIGGKWKLLILAHLACGTRRYGELKRLIPAITEKMLIQQLRELEADGIVKRTDYATVPPKVEYSLTEYNDSIRQGLEALSEWGSAHVARIAKDTIK